MKNPFQKKTKTIKKTVAEVEIVPNSFQFVVTINGDKTARIEKLVPDIRIPLTLMVDAFGSLRDMALKELHRQEFVKDYNPPTDTGTNQV